MRRISERVHRFRLFTERDTNFVGLEVENGGFEVVNDMRGHKTLEGVIKQSVHYDPDTEKRRYPPRRLCER